MGPLDGSGLYFNQCGTDKVVLMENDRVIAVFGDFQLMPQNWYKMEFEILDSLYNWSATITYQMNKASQTVNGKGLLENYNDFLRPFCRIETLDEYQKSIRYDWFSMKTRKN